MSGIGQETNNIRYVTAGTSLITMADDIINCDSAQGAIVLVLPNISGSGILSTGKCFKINDTANTAATHNITLVGVSGNKINDGATVIINTNGQCGYVKGLGLNDYLYDSPSSGMIGGFVGGSGTLNFLSKWTPDGVTIGNSLFFDNGVSVGLGTITPTADTLFEAVGTDATSSNYVARFKNITGDNIMYLRNDRAIVMDVSSFIVNGKQNGADVFSLYQPNTNPLFVVRGTNDDRIDFFAGGNVSTLYRGGNWGLGTGVGAINSKVNIIATSDVVGNYGLLVENASRNKNILITDDSGYVIIRTENATLADGNLPASSCTLYLDEAGNTLTFKAKYSGGTVKTGTIALT